jgi:hypothetical protein
MIFVALGNASAMKNSATLSQMTYNWAWLLLLFSLISIGMCLPTSLMEDLKKPEQVMKPKCKVRSKYKKLIAFFALKFS